MCNNISNVSTVAQTQYEKMGHDRSSSLSLVLEDIAARFILTCPDEEFESFERLFFQIEVTNSVVLIFL
jgi:hypothetical protein